MIEILKTFGVGLLATGALAVGFAGLIWLLHTFPNTCAVIVLTSAVMCLAYILGLSIRVS